VLIIEHDEIRAFDKCGVSLFGPTLIDGPTGLFSLAPLDKLGDPEVHFDPVNQRYWAIAQDPGNPSAPAPIGVHLAVSASQDATVWPSASKYWVQYQDPCPTNLFDMASMALHGGDVWITALVQRLESTTCDPQFVRFGQSDFFGYGIGRVSKSAAENGLPISPVWRTVAEWSQHHPVPARDLTSNAPVQYVVARNRSLAGNPNGGELWLYPLTFDSGTGTIVDPIPLKYALPVPAYYTPPTLVPQPPGGKPFDKGIGQDGRCWSAVHSNGSVWVAFVTGDVVDSTRTLIRVHEIQMNGWTGGAVITPVLRQTITVDPGNAQSAFSPSIAVQPDGLAAVTYNAVGPNAGQFISIYMSYRCPSDPLHTMRPPSLLYNHNALVGQSSPQPTIEQNHYSGTTIDSRIAGRFWCHHGLGCGIQLPTKVIRFDPPCGLDMDGSGGFDVGDKIAFQQSHVAGEPEADFEPDGVSTVKDAVVFDELHEPKP
jgi:hypothetical protein